MLLGTAAIDITPPVGTPMAGSLRPRTSVGVDDPLMCKAVASVSVGEFYAKADGSARR